MVCFTIHFSNKKVNKALRQKLVEWIMKNTNVRESPIERDTLLIIDASQNSYWNVPCGSYTMRSLLNQMMEVYLEPDTPTQMTW